MNVLIIGSGAREHALGWKIKQSRSLRHLYFGPGNPGTAALGTNLPIKTDDFGAIKKAVLENEVDLMVVGPEVPLVEGAGLWQALNPRARMRHYPLNPDLTSFFSANLEWIQKVLATKNME